MQISKIRLAGAFGLLYFGWGSLYLAIRFAIESIPPFLMIATAALIAGGVLFLAGFKKGTLPTKTHWKNAFISGILLMVIGNGGVVWGEQHVPSSVTTLLLATEMSWMILLDWIFFKGHRPSRVLVVSILVGLLGIFLLVQGSSQENSRASYWPMMIILIAAFSWSLGSLFARHAAQPDSSLLATALPMICGGAMLLLISFGMGEWTGFQLNQVSPRSWTAFFYVTFVSCVFTYTAYVWLLKVSSVERVATYTYVNPLVGVFLGWAVGGEKMTTTLLLASSFILLSVFIVTQIKPRSRFS